MPSSLNNDIILENIKLISNGMVLLERMRHINNIAYHYEVNKGGEVVLYYNDKPLVSRYSPKKELSKLFRGVGNTKGELIIVYGVHPYIVDILSGVKYPPILIMVERDIEAITLFLSYKKFQFDNFPFVCIINNLDDIGYIDIDITLITKIHNIAIRGIVSLWGDFYDNIKRLLTQKLSILYYNTLTSLELITLWYRNIILNLPSLVNNIAIRFADIDTVVVVGAGPSLRYSIDAIHSLNNYSLIIATDSALRPLIAAGISPDIVITLDGQYANIKDFAGLRYNGVLLMDITSYYGISRMFDNISFFKSSNLKIFDFMKECGIDLPFISTGGSVGTSAFSIAMSIKPKSIIIVGMDNSYLWDITHSPDTYIYKHISMQTNRFSTINSGFYNIISKRKTINIADCIRREYTLDVFYRWFCDAVPMAVNNGISVYSADRGLKIDGIEYVDIDKLGLFRGSFKKPMIEKLGVDFGVFMEKIVLIKRKLTYIKEKLKVIIEKMKRQKVDYEDDFITSFETSHPFIKEWCMRASLIRSKADDEWDEFVFLGNYLSCIKKIIRYIDIIRQKNIKKS